MAEQQQHRVRVNVTRGAKARIDWDVTVEAVNSDQDELQAIGQAALHESDRLVAELKARHPAQEGA